MRLRTFLVKFDMCFKDFILEIDGKGTLYHSIKEVPGKLLSYYNVVGISADYPNVILRIYRPKRL